MIRLTKLTCFLLLLMIFYGCNYDLTKENFVEVQPPSDSRAFDLNLIPEGDTVKIFKRTDLTYGFNTDGLDILKGSFKLQDKSWNIYSNNGSITIDPKEFARGYDTLIMALYVKSETGSIADDIGAEGYYLEKKWVMLMDDRPAPSLTPVKRITGDGLLKIEWPKCDQFNFVSYEIEGNTGNRSIRKSITNANITSFVDSLYVGGDFSVRINTRVIGSVTSGKYVTFHDDPPQLRVKEIGLDSLQISWNKSPYKAKYRLNWKDRELLYFDSAEDTICTIAQIGFGNWTDFRLCIRSQCLEGWNDLSYGCEVSSTRRYFMGNSLITANWPNFGYNPVEKVLYSNQYDEMRCFDINSYSVASYARVENLMYQALYSCPTNSSKVATISMNYIHVFNNKNFESPIVFGHGIGGAATADHFLLTNNDLIALAWDNTYKLYDIHTRQAIASLKIVDYPYYSKWACITTSQDARYMCSATRNGIKIYQFSNKQLTESYSDNRSYKSAYFNPQNPGELYLTLQDELVIEVRNPADFQLLNKIEIPSKMVIQNIDPETGNLLLTDYERLYIIDPPTGRILISVPCDEYKSWLYNNTLYTNTGSALDIADYLK